VEKLSRNLINKLSIFTESARGDEGDKAIIASFKVGRSSHVLVNGD
jgi:hypothetical protein